MVPVPSRSQVAEAVPLARPVRAPANASQSRRLQSLDRMRWRRLGVQGSSESADDEDTAKSQRRPRSAEVASGGGDDDEHDSDRDFVVDDDDEEEDDAGTIDCIGGARSGNGHSVTSPETTLARGPRTHSVRVAEEPAAAARTGAAPATARSILKRAPPALIDLDDLDLPSIADVFANRSTQPPSAPVRASPPPSPPTPEDTEAPTPVRRARLRPVASLAKAVSPLPGRKRLRRANAPKSSARSSSDDDDDISGPTASESDAPPSGGRHRRHQPAHGANADDNDDEEEEDDEDDFQRTPLRFRPAPRPRPATPSSESRPSTQPPAGRKRTVELPGLCRCAIVPSFGTVRIDANHPHPKPVRIYGPVPRPTQRGSRSTRPTRSRRRLCVTSNCWRRRRATRTLS